MYQNDIKVECFSLTFRKIEWDFLKKASFALKKSDIARTLNISLTYVNKLLTDIKSKALIYPVFNFEKMGLFTVYVFTDVASFNLPLYTKTVVHLKEFEGRGVEKKLIVGMVPEEYIKDFVDSFGKNIDYFIAYENNYINLMNNKFIFTINLDEKRIIVTPMFNFRGFAKEWLSPPQKVENIEVPDPIDLAIINFRKTRNAFMPAVKALKLAMSRSERFREYIGEKAKYLNQLAAYHFNKHYIKYWRGNTAVLTYPSSIATPMIILLEGEDHYLVARILSQMPIFLGASIGLKKSIAFGYLISSYIKNLIDFMSYFNVEWKIYINKKVLGSYTPRYYELVEKTKNGWRWLSEEEVVWARQT